ncbi:MAG: CAP domain-containing protein [Paracoccaceae bacterium]
MSVANELELLMLDLINQERAAAGLNALTIDDDLNTSSEDHSAWMLESDVFSHTGANGSTSTDRITAAGYDLEGSWATAENIGWQSERGAEGLEDDVAAIHTNLMNSPGHRANILDPNLEEIGIGIEQGAFTVEGVDYDAVMVTQNFGTTDAEDTQPGGISAVPEVAAADDDVMTETPPVDDGEVVTEVPPETPVDEEPVAEMPVDDGEDDPADEMPVDDDDDPVAEVPGEDDEDDDGDPVMDDSEITRDFVVTTGTIRQEVSETVTTDADGNMVRMRTETVTDSSDMGDDFSFDDLSDVFDFGSFEMGDDAVVSEEAFAFAGPDGIVETTDAAEFEALLAAYFDDAGGAMPCTDDMIV